MSFKFPTPGSYPGGRLLIKKCLSNSGNLKFLILDISGIQMVTVVHTHFLMHNAVMKDVSQIGCKLT